MYRRPTTNARLCRINLWAKWARAQGPGPRRAPHLEDIPLKRKKERKKKKKMDKGKEKERNERGRENKGKKKERKKKERKTN